MNFRLRVQQRGEINVTDNTAANNIDLACTDGKNLTIAGNLNGQWGDRSPDCPRGICGISTLVKARVVVGDNTALNNVAFECC